MKKTAPIFLVLTFVPHSTRGLCCTRNCSLIYTDVVIFALHAGIRIGFGEVDYYGDEGDGQVRVILTKLECTTANVTVAIKLSTYEALGRELPDALSKLGIPADAAECEATVV